MYLEITLIALLAIGHAFSIIQYNSEIDLIPQTDVESYSR